MTPEQQRIAIAEACGWKYEPRKLHLSGIPIEDSFPWIKPDGSRAFPQEIPNYPNDLNAMHEAEKTLTDEQYDDFVSYLLPEDERKHYKSWGLEGIGGFAPRHLISPTAAQRAEAFLRTLNLWTK